MTEPLNRRDFLKAFGASAAALTLPSRLLGQIPSSTNRPPNIVLILADDLGYECLGCNGSTSYKTPHLNKLAAGGMRFDSCHVQPLCTPTRVQLMTGMYNVRNYVSFGNMDPNQTTFANILKSHNYATCMAGKWQLGADPDLPKKFGFDEYCLWQHLRKPGKAPRYPNPGLEINGKIVDYTNGEYGPDVISDYALDFMTRKKGSPFFLYYTMLLPHYPLQATPDSPDWDPKVRGEKQATKQKHFPDMVAYMDKLVGKLIDRLEELGLRENTLVLFVGDNGTDGPITSKLGDRKIKGGKNSTRMVGTHVPLIANWLGTIKPGQVCRDLIDSTDFLPTMCAAAQATVPERLTIDGQSFLPQLRGEESTPRQWYYVWYGRGGTIANPSEFAANHDFKLYRDGRFYDLKADADEQSPLNPDALTPAAISARTLLQEALDKYKDARPARLAARAPATQPAADE